MKYIPYLHLSNAIEKRCPNGYHKNPKTGQCEPKGQKGTASTSTGCQEGFHQHAGYKNCHEIWKPHKPHTLSCNQHRLLGIPCRYKGEVLDENGRPVEKGIPTRKWLKQAKDKKKEQKEKEQKDDKPKEEPIVGLPKHQMVNKTRNMMMESYDSFKELKEMGDNVVNVLESFNPEKGKIRATYKKAFKNLPWCNKVSFNKSISDDDLIEILPDITKAIKENPIGLLIMSGFLTNFKKDYIMSFMSWSPESDEIGNIQINKGFVTSSGKPAKYVKKTDTISGEVTDWSFHFINSSKYTSFSHEWGHAMFYVMSVLRHMSSLSKMESSESKEARKKAVTDMLDEPIKVIREYKGKGDDYKVDFRILSDWGSGNPIVKIDEYFDIRSKEYLEMVSKIKELGFRVNWSNLEESLWIRLSDSKLKELPPRSGFKKYVNNDTTTLRNLVGEHELSPEDLLDDVFPYKTELIKECREVYRELYGVDEIIPSDVYSGYGYLGTTRGWGSDSDDEYEVESVGLTWENADERVAEAFSDVVVRGEKANSMSNILVSAVQYYIYSSLNDNAESFKEYMLRNYNKDNIGERIIKHRYINRNPYTDSQVI